jgi:hypothetical protein
MKMVTWWEEIRVKPWFVRSAIALLIIGIGISCAAASITVLHAENDITAMAGEEVSIVGNFTYDPDTDGEIFEAQISWGDGSDPEPVSPLVSGGIGNVTAAHTYYTASTYAVHLNVTNGTVWEEALVLNVTVLPQSADETKIVPRTWNVKSNGIMTVFVTLAQLFGFADEEAGQIDRDALQMGDVSLEGVEPSKINFCRKDGGTFILKFKRPDVREAVQDKLEGSENVTLNVTGNMTSGDTTLSFTGQDTIDVRHSDNGKAAGLEKNADKDKKPKKNSEPEE